MAIKVEMDTSQLMRRLKGKSGEYDRGLRRGIMYAGLALQADSQRIVPVDTGQLKRSARTDSVTPDTDEDFAVEVSYSTDYAIYVHEMTHIPHHTPSEAQAKFLEQPARENSREYIEIIKNEVS